MPRPFRRAALAAGMASAVAHRANGGAPTASKFENPVGVIFLAVLPDTTPASVPST